MNLMNTNSDLGPSKFLNCSVCCNELIETVIQCDLALTSAKNPIKHKLVLCKECGELMKLVSKVFNKIPDIVDKLMKKSEYEIPNIECDIWEWQNDIRDMAKSVKDRAKSSSTKVILCELELELEVVNIYLTESLLKLKDKYEK